MSLLLSLQTDYYLESHVFVTEPTDGLFYGESCLCHRPYRRTIPWRVMSLFQNLESDYSMESRVFVTEPTD